MVKNTEDAGQPPRVPAPSAETEVQRLTHELGVHQVELELQNEELRRAQSALEASRDRYVDLYERAPIAYVTLNSEGLILEANRRAAQVLRVAQSQQMQGRALTEFVHFDERPRLQQLLRKTLRDRNEHSLELRLAPGDGAACWMALQMVAASTGPDGTLQCRAALIDISERVRLQQNVSLLAAIVASSEDAIVSRDLDGRVTSWNAGAARLFGPEAAEMLGCTMDALVPRERANEERQLLRQLRLGHTVAHIETERLQRGGTPVSVSMSLSPLRDAQGLVIGSALIARDISERRRAERSLHERLRHLDVLSHAGQMLILGERDVNSIRRELFERVRSAVGADVRMTYGVTDDPGRLKLLSSYGLDDGTREALASVSVADTLCGLVAQRRVQLVLDDLLSSKLPQAAPLQALGVHCYAGFPMQAHGRLYGVAAFASTRRDSFGESELLVIRTVCDQVAAMMEHTRLLAELNTTDQMLKRADRAKDDFIATLAHELRSPLAPIRNALGVLRRPELSTPQQQAWCRDIIERQVVQMTRLLEDLLDVSRLTRNKIELRLEHLELARVIEHAVEATQPLLDAQHHRFVLDLPPEPVVVHGDLTRLTQVFANLLSNAAKYSDAGGRITLRAWLEPEAVCVSVSDSGIGIDVQQLPHVFDMFAQLAPALERAGGGLGIGLALARGLVELHGGTMAAHSAGPGQGSEFVVRLPVTSQSGPADDHGQDAAAPEPVPPRHRVLVVDDNADAAESLAALLELHGQDVRVALSGADALRIAHEWAPEVGVLDIGMPAMNGYQLCRELRAQAQGRQPLLIACTGWGQEADRDRARAAGFDVHLVKPVDPNAVLRLLMDRDKPRP